MKSFYISISCFLICTAACNGTARSTPEIKRDTTITPGNSFSELFLDSNKVESFINFNQLSNDASHRLRNFYNGRNYQFAWFTKSGLAEQTRAFWNLQQNYITLSKDSLLIDTVLSKSLETLLTEDKDLKVHADELISIELQLTQHFFKYVEYAYAGKFDPEELSWHIPRKKVNEMELLDSLIANKGQHSETWEPLNRQYNLLKEKLLGYYQLEKSELTDSIPLPGKKTYKVGDTSLIVARVKKKLIELNDYLFEDTSANFNPELVIAVQQAQKRFGLPKHGIINSTLVKALNIPVKERIRQMLINMERMRWLPKEPPGNYLLANIPEFKLHIVEDSKNIFEMNIIVGKTANRTIIFNEMLKYVVFSPYWNIPPSIVKDEILPGIRQNRGYLRSKNMEQTGYEEGLPVIRQRPGADNSLGRVKFIFPNNYNIYFHDTPQKSLFKEPKRAFSHGCIRLAEPEKLAVYLLKDQVRWTREKIAKAMNDNEENWVIIKEPVPVVITYFTAWVDQDGLLNFREDVYGHDQTMAGLLFASGTAR